jgi:DNA mismatch endonuclease (patch repair protein)
MEHQSTPNCNKVMTDRITRANRSENMRKIRSAGMAPEMAVRLLVHGLGFRYRLNRHDLPGRPDLVFGPKKKVIFVHGCFWHAHECSRSHKPKSNKKYWNPKLLSNKQRDRRNILALKKAGWRSLVIWECETKNTPKIEKQIISFLES